MTDTVSAYQNHEFIRTSIDLLCAGAAWRGGRFVYNNATPSEPKVDEATLEALAKEILLRGKTTVSIVKQESHFTVRQIIGGSNRTEGLRTIDIERVESSFLPVGEPILQRVLQYVDLYENSRKRLRHNPSEAKLLIDNALSAIYNTLAISPALLNPNMNPAPSVEVLMMGATQYISQVNLIRHIILKGLNDVGEAISELGQYDLIDWVWNEEWIPPGLCKYGHVYQVFMSKGISLDRIKDRELGGIKRATEFELVSQETYQECVATYGY